LAGYLSIWTDYRNGNLDIYYYDLEEDKEKQITNDPSDQIQPKIYDDYIAWTDYRNGGSPQGLYTDAFNEMPELDTDVFVYNLKTGEEKQITKTGSNQTLADIWNNKVFFYEKPNNLTNLYCYDILTEQSNMIQNPGKYFSDVAVYNNRIVYGANRGSPSAGPRFTTNEDIFMLDIESNAETQITTNPEQQTGPDIFGDYVVWNDWRYFDEDDVGDNYLYSLKSKKEIKMTSDRDVSYPKVSDKYVVYIENRKHESFFDDQRISDDEIFVYNINDKSEFQLTLASGAKYSIEIWGSKIVWADLQDQDQLQRIGYASVHYNTDIYFYDLGDIIDNTTRIMIIIIFVIILIIGVAALIKIRNDSVKNNNGNT
jgi:beta propeller repeat protein